LRQRFVVEFAGGFEVERGVESIFPVQINQQAALLDPR
jgi:hypothetical protein